MKLLVLSDSHGCVKNVNMILSKATDADAVFFLGDGCHDLPSVQKKTIYSVRGNCDASPCGYDSESVQIINGITIYACHGHLKNVRSGLLTLAQTGIENHAQVCLYGHTHIPDIDFYKGIWFMNPGAAKDGRYGILELKENGTIYPSLHILSER